mgnify:CR=1 FL=1
MYYFIFSETIRRIAKNVLADMQGLRFSLPVFKFGKMCTYFCCSRKWVENDVHIAILIVNISFIKEQDL